MKKKYLWLGIGVTVSVIFVIIMIFCSDIYGWEKNSESVTITITENDNATVICKKLEENGVVLNQHLFKIYYKSAKTDAIIHPGIITVHKNDSYQEIIEAIFHPKSNTVHVTIPEGFELSEIAKRLLENNIISDEEAFYNALQEYTLTTKQGTSISGQDILAGFLFPDTYEFKKDISCKEVIDILTGNFLSKWTNEHESKAKLLDMNMQEVMILASIVEREARKPEDFPLVASVFLNRLKIEKPLESCATVQFILKERKPVLSVEDTKIDSPFNTYQHKGLPPAPISAPGMRAIDAVLSPAETEYLYFFTDKNGINHYSKTYEEHNNQILKFGL